MIFDISVVDVIWKLIDIIRLSLFFGMLLFYIIFWGCILLVGGLDCMLELVFSRCCKKYLLFLFDELIRFVC